jgi:uncharacterized protein (TIGR02246 family)
LGDVAVVDLYHNLTTVSVSKSIRAQPAGAVMAASKPEECDILLMNALNAGDLEVAVALYEPDAKLKDLSGATLNGHEQIREAIRQYLALRLQMTRETQVVISSDGRVAMTGGKWRAAGNKTDGTPIEISGDSHEIVRRQADGSWRFVIDDPWGWTRV